MNTEQAAQAIGTSQRVLRQFLRSPQSTFVPVGSAARYEFNDTELDTLRKLFQKWRGTTRGRKPTRRADETRISLKSRHDTRMSPVELQRLKDEQVWAEEGMVKLPNIRDPRILAEVRAAEAQRNATVEMLLLARGMHVTQWGDR